MEEDDIEFIKKLMEFNVEDENESDKCYNNNEKSMIHTDDEDPYSEEIQAILYEIYKKYLDYDEYQSDYLTNIDKLKGYKYIDNPKELRSGDYIRYIEMKEPGTITLNQGGLVERVDSSIQLKSIRNQKSFWRISFSSIIFLKISCNKRNTWL